MKRDILRALALLIALLAPSLAFGQQAALATDAKIAPIHPALSVRQALEVAGALGQMNCEPKLISDGAKQTMACPPYSTDRLKIGLAWQIAQSQAKIKPVIELYQRERNRLLALAERKTDGNITDKAMAKFLAEDAELLDASSGVTIERFKKSEIEPLNLQPGIIASLIPIIDEK